MLSEIFRFFSNNFGRFSVYFQRTCFFRALIFAKNICLIHLLYSHASFLMVQMKNYFNLCRTQLATKDHNQFSMFPRIVIIFAWQVTFLPGRTYCRTGKTLLTSQVGRTDLSLLVLSSDCLNHCWSFLCSHKSILFIFPYQAKTV